MKKFERIAVMLVLSIIFTLFSPYGVYAEEETLPADARYHIVDYLESGKVEEFASFDSYEEARTMYDAVLEEKNNPAIVHQGKLILVHYGFVSFRSSDLCDYNVEYTNADTRENGYLNGCYAKDGLFLDTYSDGVQVKFQISGVNAWAALADVEIIPLQEADNLSSYRISKGHLIHDLSNGIRESGSSASIRLDEAPSFMEEQTTYYSYDGIYFYQEDAIKEMIEDARAMDHRHAVNASSPYYNYYQYVSHRSSSVYSAEEIEDYLKEQRGAYASLTHFLDDDQDGIHDVLTQSLLSGSATALLQNQNLYGSNALMMLAVSMNESAMGRSKLSYLKNNLFGHAAYDSSAAESASRYLHTGESIKVHADAYVSRSYADPSAYMYHGAYFGNKQSGMNVSYASDPYWGEKAASYFYRMDDALGGKQKEAYALGIVNMAAKIPVYDSTKKKKQKVLYEVDHLRQYSFLILGKVETSAQDYYQIQCDPLLEDTEEHYYRFQDNIGYIECEAVDTVLNASALKKQAEYARMTFDAGKGRFENGEKKLVMDVQKGDLPAVEAPQRKGYLFAGWDKEITAAKKKTTYRATYTKIQSVEWEEPKTSYGYGDTLDVNGCVFTFTAKNGTRQKVPLTSEMVSGYDMEKLGKQKLQIHVLGNTYTYTIEVKENKKRIKQQETQTEINAIIAEFAKRNVIFTGAEKKRILAARDAYYESKPNLSMWEIREFEKIVSRVDQNSTITLHASKETAGISGATLAFPSAEETRTIQMEIDENVKSKQQLLLKTTAKNNGYEAEAYYRLVIKEEDQVYETLDVPLILSLPKPEKASDQDVYQVYAYVDGEVIRLETTQTQNQIKWKTKYAGSFAIVKQKQNDVKAGEDIAEFTAISEEPAYPWLPYAIAAALFAVLVGAVILVFRYRKGRRLHHRKVTHLKKNR